MGEKMYAFYHHIGGNEPYLGIGLCHNGTIIANAT
jgi:hypothetical protein